MWLKVLVMVLLSVFHYSCQSGKNDEMVMIDLSDAEDRLNYSSFVDSVSYVTLQMKEDAYIGGVERLYRCGDFYYVWGTHRSGVFVFDASGKLYSHINSFGEGPEDFRMISSFSVIKSTGDICIMDFPSQKMKFFAKDGAFQESFPYPYWNVDVAAFDSDNIVFISPYYAGEKNPSGIWLGNKDKALMSHLSNDVTSEHQLYYFPMTYCWGDTCVYYYDRNWDYFSSVSPNGMEIICQFDLKQKIPQSIIRNVNSGDPSKLNGYAICDRFVCSPSCMLILYCKFEEEGKRSYVWVMTESNGKLIKQAKELHNDMDHVLITSENLFQLDEKTWARLCEEEPDNFNVKIQLLHLKSN